MMLVVQAGRQAEVAHALRQAEIAQAVRQVEMVLLVQCFHECSMLCLLV